MSRALSPLARPAMLAARPAAIVDPSEHPSHGQDLLLPGLFCRVTIRRISDFRVYGSEFVGQDWPPLAEALLEGLINTG